MDKIIKKFLVYAILLSMCLTFVNPSKTIANKASSENENIDIITNKLKEIQKEGITGEEIKDFIKFLEEKYGGDSIYMNTMCKVIGIGAGILFPPFIPLSPMLISFPITALTTQGLQGEWSHTVNIAIFIAFAGVPIYIPPPPLFIILGYAGAVIGIRFD